MPASRSGVAGSPLVDSFGRRHNKLRVSVTDRCNLRCVYCMPAVGATFRPRDELLTLEEIARVVRVLAGAGVNEVRLTGGEPLLRPALSELAEAVSRTPGIRQVGLTTNALLLPRYAEMLRRSGVSHVNISLDAADRESFLHATRRDEFEATLAGIKAAQSAGFASVKINAISMRGITDEQVIPLAEFARRTGLEVRFIEYMPLDASQDWERQKVLPAAELLRTLGNHFGALVPTASPHASPATTYRFADGRGLIGVIPSVTRPFCGDCNRFRLTADGQFRACLFSHDETDIRALLRGGGNDAEILAAARRCLAAKWEGHGINTVDFNPPARAMYSIGG